MQKMASILKSLEIKNFKGFSETVRIELRPITLLFGANSAGKSSVLQALQYVREILERGNTNPDRTQQGGEAVDLGGFLNLVHGRDPEKRIEVEVEMELGDTSIPELVPEAFDEWQTSEQNVWDIYDTLQAVRRKMERVSVRLIIGWSAVRETAVVVGYHVGANGQWCVEINASADGRDVTMRINPDNSIFESDELDKISAEFPGLDGWLTAEELSGLIHEEDHETTLSDSTSVLPGVLYAVREAGMEKPGQGLRAWLNGFRGALPNLDRMLEIPVVGASGASNVYICREFTAFLSWLTIGPAMLLRDQLKTARYVGPLRRIPPRAFDISLTKSESAWSDGMAAWESLLTSSQVMVKRCSDWMQRSDRLNTGYGLRRSQVREHDADTGQPCGRVRSRITLVDQKGLTHQPQDVGVGISQILPIVVAAQDDRASIISVEQPELHVHPAIQVGLGDLFIDGALERGLSFILETHSEHLILRLLRRIRESTSGDLPDGLPQVTPEILAVYFLDKANGAINAIKLPVDENGEFKENWPRGFFDERIAEFFGPTPEDIDEQLSKLFPA